MAYHPLTLFSGCVVIASWIMFFGFWIAAIRMFHAHRRAEKAAEATGRKITHVLCGASLPTLLRVTLIGCTTAGVVLLPFAAIMVFLKIPTVDHRGALSLSPFSDGSNDFSSDTRLCIACAKLVTSGYVQAKAWTYSFLFIKGRIAQPNQKMKWHEWIVLAATLAMPVFAAVVGWLTRASRNMLDDTCEWLLPPWLIIVMAIADSILSVLYLASFIRPLRQIIAANRMRIRRTPLKPTGAVAQAPSETGSVLIRVSSPLTTTPSHAGGVGSSSPRDRIRQLDVSSTVSFAAVSFATPVHPIIHPTRDPDHGDALEVVLRKNLLSCVVCVVSTLLALLMILLAHMTSNPYLERLNTPFGIFDLCTVLVSLFLLMHSASSAAGQSASSPDASRLTHVRGKSMKLQTQGLHSSRQHQPQQSLLGSPSQALRDAAVERSTATVQPALSTPMALANSPALPAHASGIELASRSTSLAHGAHGRAGMAGSPAVRSSPGHRSSGSAALFMPAVSSQRWMGPMIPDSGLQTVSGRGKGILDGHGTTN